MFMRLHGSMDDIHWYYLYYQYKYIFTCEDEK